METREPTFGERAVGLSFNPSGNENVNTIKKHYADVIDLLHGLQETAEHEAKRQYAIAITDAETAQMRAVKAITWK
jgi:hypothetical protein